MRRWILVLFLLLAPGTVDGQDTRRTWSECQSLLADNVTGQISPQDLRECLMAPWQAVVNAQTGTTYTFAALDRFKHVTFNNATGVSATLPQAGSAGFEDGWMVYVENIGSGTVTITPTTSTINGASSLSLATNEWAIIFSDGTNYRAFGPGATGKVYGGAAQCLAYYSSTGTIVDDAQNSGSVCALGFDPTANTLTLYDTTGTATLRLDGDDGSIENLTSNPTESTWTDQTAHPTAPATGKTKLYTLGGEFYKCDDADTCGSSGKMLREGEKNVANGVAGLDASARIAKAQAPSTAVYTDQANTYTAGAKQTFQASASTAGVNIAAAALPSTPATGDIVVDSGASNTLKWYDGTAWQSAGGSGGGGASVTGSGNALFWLTGLPPNDAGQSGSMWSKYSYCYQFGLPYGSYKTQTILVEITTAGTAGNGLVAGLYDSSGNLEVQFGPITAIDTVGVKQLTATSAVTLSGGTHYVCFATDDATLRLRIFAVNSATVNDWFNSDASRVFREGSARVTGAGSTLTMPSTLDTTRNTAPYANAQILAALTPAT